MAAEEKKIFVYDGFSEDRPVLIGILSVLMCARLPTDFIFKASTTTFALPEK